MDGDRKYRQRGYQDSQSSQSGEKKPSQQFGEGPRAKISNGPRLPRLVQAVTASRCFNCATTLPPGTDFAAQCPKCQADLHCCKQCAYFEPSTRFQCQKPITERIAVKDKRNECPLFSPRVTVARDANGSAMPAGTSAPQSAPAPTNPRDARLAFDQLFKK